MKKFASALVLVTSAMLPFNAIAVYECDVTVQNVLVYSNGMVNIFHSGRGAYTMLCNVSADYGDVSATTCVMWTAMLQAIKKKNGIAKIYFNGTGSCATLPTYSSAPIPVYIGDVTP